MATRVARHQTSPMGGWANCWQKLCRGLEHLQQTDASKEVGRYEKGEGQTDGKGQECIRKMSEMAVC